MWSQAPTWVFVIRLKVWRLEHYYDLSRFYTNVVYIDGRLGLILTLMESNNDGICIEVGVGIVFIHPYHQTTHFLTPLIKSFMFTSR